MPLWILDCCLLFFCMFMFGESPKVVVIDTRYSLPLFAMNLHSNTNIKSKKSI